MPAPFTCRSAGPLPPAPPGWFAVAYAPMRDGALACFQATSDITGVERRNRRALAAGRHSQQVRYFGPNDRCRLVRGDGEEASAELPLEDPFPRFDQLADGGWIVVNARRRQGELNATRLSAQGELVARFAVGDAVEQVQADGAGGVWVSYFDEGMTDKLGSAGLAHFDASGQRTWRANNDEAVLPFVLDCYALNAVRDEAWACYYSDFPIVRVRRDGEVRVWANDITGAAAIAVDRDRVVLFGGYAEERWRIALLELGSKTANLVGELRLAGPAASRSQAVGRGDTIHIIGDNTWRRFTVAEIAERLGS